MALAQGPLPHVPSVRPAPPVVIGLALDLGGKRDGGLGQSAWEGAQRAERDFGVKAQAFTPQATTGAVAHGSEALAKAGAALVIAVGDANTSSLEKAAGKSPSTRFALVDELPTGANTAGLIFSENEGSFLVGYIAAQSSSTGVLGFVGGQDTPGTHELEDGYRAGVHLLCPICKVLSTSIGATPAAWNDPAVGAVLTASLQAQGTDVIYAAAGKSNAGVVKQVNAAQGLDVTSLPAGLRFPLESRLKQIVRLVGDGTVKMPSEKSSGVIAATSRSSLLSAQRGLHAARSTPGRGGHDPTS